MRTTTNFLAPALARRNRLAGIGSPESARRNRLAALAASGAAEDFTNFQVSFGGHPLPPATPRFPKAAVPFRPATVHLPKVTTRGRKVAVRGGKVTAHGRKVAVRGEKVTAHGRKVAVHLPIVAVTFRPGTATFPPFSAKTTIFPQISPISRIFGPENSLHRRKSAKSVDSVAGGRMRGNHPSSILHLPSSPQFRSVKTQ